MKHILIAYGSKTGSTKEVAEEIARVMTSSKTGDDRMVAEARPFAQAGSLEEYDGVIVGAPINGMRWLPEALSFVDANRGRLAKIPVAYFLLSVAITGKSFLTKKVYKCLDPASVIVKPVKTGFFGGMMSAEPPAILRFAFGLPKNAPKDARDWDAVRKWATETSEAFLSR